MTRNRALKHAIRERAARTGERYTTARRHVLKAASSRPTAPTGAPAATPTPPTAKGTVSEARVLEKTGHGLAHWFAVLDRFGAVEKGHSAAARHLFDEHGVSGWYAQGITVAYERARGVRAVNQRTDGNYEVSVSKVVNASVATIVTALTSTRARKEWALDAHPASLDALTAGIKDKTSKGVIVRPDGLGRWRFKWNGTVVQFYLEPKGKAKTSLVVQQMKLANAAAVDEHRAHWKQTLTALAAHLAPR